MTLQVVIKGGTKAGRKKSYRGTPADWFCNCETHRQGVGDALQIFFKKQRGFLKKCLDCDTDRSGRTSSFRVLL